MIDFLSAPDWINPQINFLLYLQNIRNEHFECLNKIFLSITILGEMWLPTLICSIIYWCIDSKKGVYLFSLFGIELLATQFFKMIACVYRPWVLSDKIKPVELAISAAKGYSFPSGHSATSSSVLGGTAYLYRKNKPLCIFLIITILLVGFSRMWLGVHTPQDVITGLSIGLILIFLINFVINKIENHKNGYLYFIAIVDIIAILALTYICYFNQYPKDFIGGKLLVDPIHSIYCFVVCYGYSLGLINGAGICRKFFSFDASIGSVKSKIVRGTVDSILTVIILKQTMGYIFNNSLDCKLALIIACAAGLFATLIYPVIFVKLSYKNYEDKAQI